MIFAFIVCNSLLHGKKKHIFERWFYSQKFTLTPECQRPDPMRLILLGHWLTDSCLGRVLSEIRLHKAFITELTVATVAARKKPLSTSAANADAVINRL